MKRYRILKFSIDATRNIFKFLGIEQQKKEMKDYLISQYGGGDFDNKFNRFTKVEKPVLGIIEEYRHLLDEIVDAYIIGYFYPALTGACCLGERIFNVLLLRLREYYISTSEYKIIHNQDSFNNWEKSYSILRKWDVIDEDVKELFKKLAKIRHASIHYRNTEQDLYKMTADAISYVNNITNRIFGILDRKDILLLFNVPGEIYIKKEAEKIPLVREFYIPSAYLVGYKHKIEATVDNDIPDLEKMKLIDNFEYLDKEVTDEEFIKLRIGEEESTNKK